MPMGGMPAGRTMTAMPGQSMIAARPVMTVTGPDFNRNGIPDVLEGGYGGFGYGGYGMTAAPMAAPAMTSYAAPVARPMPTMAASYVPPPVTTMARPMPVMTASYVPPPVATMTAVSTSYVPPTTYRQEQYVAQPRQPGKRCIGERPVARDELRATGNLVEGPPVALPRKPEPPMRVPQPVVEVVTAPPVQTIVAPPVMAAPPMQVVTAPPVMQAPPVMMAPAAQPMMMGQMIVTGPDRNRDGIPDVLQGGPNTNVTTSMAMPGMMPNMGMPMTAVPMGPPMPMGMPPTGSPGMYAPHTHKETRPVTHGAHGGMPGAHGGMPGGYGAPPGGYSNDGMQAAAAFHAFT